MRRLGGTPRRIAWSFHLAPMDIDDVVQATWLELVEHIGKIQEPAAIHGWLATTARHKAMRTRRRAAREEPTDPTTLGQRQDANRELEADAPEARLLANEQRTVLARALATLPVRQRELMKQLLAEPPREYAEISRTLSMPTGSIGPTRARALAGLARDPQLRAVQG